MPSRQPRLVDPVTEHVKPNVAGLADAHSAEELPAARLPDLISQTALELVPDAFVGIGANGEIVLANAQTEALFGYLREQLIGQPVEMLIPEGFADAHRSQRAAHFADSRTRPIRVGLEVAGRRRDGSEFSAEISLSSIEIDGQVLATGTIRDISKRIAVVRGKERLKAEVEKERLEAEVEKERLLNELHHARRLESLGELAGGIAHDFNNLLAVIINYAAFVAEELDAAGPASDEEKRDTMRTDVEQISLAAQRAAHLTHQLLAFARREVVQPEVVDVNAVVTDVEQLLKSTLGEHIELRSELTPDLRSVLIDPGRLEQILVNLAVNARDAMPDGGTLTIHTANLDIDEAYTAHRSELAPGPYVDLHVSDNGNGMTREVAERAFDPFFTTKPAGQGTGLGLATIYGIVEQAGGRAQIRSESGVGTTATVLLPATDATASRTAQQIGAAQLRGEATILLVEDEDALREVTRRILVGSGYRVITAADGDQALAAAAEQSEAIDLLLTDVVMPQMHGPALAEQIQRVRPSIRVMFMSGFAQPILESGGHLEAGVTLVEKPFSGPALLAKVSQVLKLGTQGT
jgi:two-component system, cell cycle sensor histidine kinase and response regulator CckA